MATVEPYAPLSDEDYDNGLPMRGEPYYDVVYEADNLWHVHKGYMS
jgi:hypothetical protein